MALRLLSLDFDPVYGESATRATFTGDVSVFDGVPDWRDFIREESTSEPGNGGKK